MKRFTESVKKNVEGIQIKDCWTGHHFKKFREEIVGGKELRVRRTTLKGGIIKYNKKGL